MIYISLTQPLYIFKILLKNYQILILITVKPQLDHLVKERNTI